MKYINKISLSVSSFMLLALPMFVFAQPTGTGLANSASGGKFGDLLENILGFTNSTLIPFIIGIGFLVFVFGMFRYFIAGGANDDAKASGRSLMIYATLGFVLIIVFWGVINLIASSTGLDADKLDTKDVNGVELKRGN